MPSFCPESLHFVRYATLFVTIIRPFNDLSSVTPGYLLVSFTSAHFLRRFWLSSRSTLPAPFLAAIHPLLPGSPCGILNGAALIELVAQLVEHRPFKALVLGSSPSELTTPGRPMVPQSQVL